MLTSKSPLRSAWNQAALSSTRTVALSPIFFHWSTSQMASGSYGSGRLRLLSTKAKPSGTLASRSSRRASAREASRSRPNPASRPSSASLAA